MRLILGEGGERAREEQFLDGQFTVVSRDGLHHNQRAILPHLPQGKTGRALVINSDYGVLALALRVLNPQMEVVCHYDDAWAAGLARETMKEYDPEIELVLSPDPPAGPWNYIVMPLERRGIADLVRERIRLAAAEYLAPQGKLITSSDTKDDRFIRDEVKKAFGALHMAPEDRRRGAVAYVAKKPAKQLRAAPHSWTTFTVREDGQTLSFESRLGIFCHDRLDPGTHAMLSLAEVGDAKRILDLGCGSGVVGIVAALRSPEARVTFLDSNARAIEAAQRNATTHGLADRAEAFLLTADPAGAVADLPKFDLVLTNPPYYGNWRIAEMFLDTARKCLKPGGKLIVVTKSLEWYKEQLKPDFTGLQEQTKGGYMVLTATRQRPKL